MRETKNSSEIELQMGERKATSGCLGRNLNPHNIHAALLKEEG
jgi:hypothetical protein